MSWFFAATIEDIPPRGARVVTIAHQAIAIFRTSDNRVHALADRCPHRGGPLSQGIVHSHCVTCPLHDWVIDLESGEAQGPDEGATATFEVRVESERIYIHVPQGGKIGRTEIQDDPSPAVGGKVDPSTTSEHAPASIS